MLPINTPISPPTGSSHHNNQSHSMSSSTTTESTSTPTTPKKLPNRYRPTNLIIPSVIDEHHTVTVTCLTNNSSTTINSSSCPGIASMTPCESCHSSCLSGSTSTTPPTEAPFGSLISSPTSLLSQHEKDFYRSMGFEMVKPNVAKGITSNVNLVRRSSAECVPSSVQPENSSVLPETNSYSKPDQYPTSSISLSPDNEDIPETLYEDTTLFAEKVITLNSEHSNHTLTDIEREERCLLKCASSPYIVNLYKSTRSSKYHHRFFLEYIDGFTLANLVESRRSNFTPICERELGLIAQQLIRALVFLKENGLLHRDIKSENIMITKNGCVKLIDLGLAIELDLLSTNELSTTNNVNSGETTTEPESVITKGTYSFMCPNKLLTGKEGYESDVYSLGMTLLEAFMGKLPFDFDNSTDNSFPLADIVSFDIEEYCQPLLESGRMSYELQHFLSLCMNRESDLRAKVHSLLSHPFLVHTFGMNHNELCSS